MRIKTHEITFGNIVNLFWGCLEKIFATRYLNLFKTVYLNFRLLPFSQAVRLPIFVYGGLKIVSLIGRGEVKGKVSMGMIRFGNSSCEEFVGHTKSLFSNQGTVIFRGKLYLFNGFCIRVCRGKTLEIGDHVMCSSNVSIYALDDITIGNQTRIAFNSLIMASDMHYSIDTKTRAIHVNSAPIVIGDCNWITSNVRVMKGTVTPPWTIVTSGSFLNRDYADFIEPESIIGGVPAKLIKQGQRRVFSLENESMLANYFAGIEVTPFVLDDDIDLDLFCKR